MLVVEQHDFRHPRALPSVLAFADGIRWARRAELHLDNGDFLVVQHGRGWLQSTPSSGA